MRPAGSGVLKLEITEVITPEWADAVSRYVSKYPDYEIDMLVDTVGGNWAASHSIFFSLVDHPRRVNAEIRLASSGGALVSMAADFRRLSPSGSFFVHWPVADEPVPAELLQQIAEKKAALMASRCRIPANRLLQWMKAETRIDAPRALACGLVHEVPGLAKPKHAMVFL